VQNSLNNDTIDLRRYYCEDCKNTFYVECDADQYPECCPYCTLKRIKKAKDKKGEVQYEVL
jgi:DNA-directed RNA polymerase subunit RPC12/RpoP